MTDMRDTRRAVETYLKNLPTPVGAEVDAKVLPDALTAMDKVRQQTVPSSRPIWRTIMRHKRTRVAAVVALAVLLIGAFGLGTGSVAFSQARYAVDTTLSWLKDLIVGTSETGAGAARSLPPAPSSHADKGTTDPDRRVVTCAARFLAVPESEQGVWQSLRDQGIEFVQASTDPEAYYAVLSHQQGEWLDTSVSLQCLAAPRVTVFEGDAAALALRNGQPQEGLALGLLPVVASDGREVRSDISFHDGVSGFEIPSVGTEPGELVLIRVKGMFPTLTDADARTESDSAEVLIRVRVDIQ